MKINTVVKNIGFFAVICLTIAACTKGAGPGGRASIKGKIFSKNLSSSLSVITDSGFVGEQDVYLSYGTSTAVADRVFTSHTGEFEFLYLRPGKYTVVTYSKQPFGVGKLDSAVIKTVEIDSKSQTADMGIIRIYTNKN